ncbi:MAG: glycerophosphodiester phosphodiesterase [Candidatus Helarchaeota archaeon]
MHNSSFIIIAHRGASGYVLENSFAAFDKAIELHADMIETDVQVTKDGELILMHDPMLDRTTFGAGLIEKMTFQEIQGVKMRNQENIPTLKEFLKRYGKNIGLDVELKAKHIEESVYALVKKYNLIGTVILSSLSFGTLETLHQIDKNLQLSWISNLSEYRLKTTVSYEKFLNTGIKYIQPLHFSVSLPFIKKVNQFNLKIFPWPIDSKRLAIKFKDDFSVDGIITKFPDIMNKNDNFDRSAAHL